MHLDPKEFIVVPTGDYPAKIKDITEEEGKFGAQLKFIFDIGEVEDIEGNVEERTLSAWCSQTLSFKSKLWGWCQAAGLDPTEGVDTEDLIGKRVVLTVVVTKKDGKTYNKIESVRRPAKRANGSAAAPRPTVVEDDEDENDEPATMPAPKSKAGQKVPF